MTSNTTTSASEIQTDDFDEDRFEEVSNLAQHIWQSVHIFASARWDEIPGRYGLPEPPQSIATMLHENADRFTRQEQEEALQMAVDLAEGHLDRLQKDMEQTRRALTALRQPKADLMRSLIKQV